MLEAMDEGGVSKLGADLAEQLGPSGFELHPFLVGWYNERVDEKFFSRVTSCYQAQRQRSLQPWVRGWAPLMGRVGMLSM